MTAWETLEFYPVKSEVLEQGGVDDEERDFDAVSDYLVLNVVEQRTIG